MLYMLLGYMRDCPGESVSAFTAITNANFVGSGGIYSAAYRPISSLSSCTITLTLSL